MKLKVKMMIMHKYIVLLLMINSGIMSYAMESDNAIYERFRAAYIQAHPDGIAKIWRELKQLTILERDECIIAFMAESKKRGDCGISRIFTRICTFCMEPTSQITHETNCKCKSHMCKECFRTVPRCPRCDVKF